MKKRVIFGWMSAVAIALSLQAGAAFATTETINVGQVYTGATPDGSPPWLVATFSSTGANTGTLTLTSNLSGSDFLQGLESSHAAVGWAFYVNQSISGISCASGNCANSNSGFNAGGFNTGPVPGTFNLAFGWGPQNRFGMGDSAVYDLTFSNALSGDPFGANGSGWWSVAHVQGIIGPNGDSGWIVSGTSVGVPEPAELGLFGAGVLLVGLFAGLRRRWQ
jgi:hypothetical protein